MLLWFLEFMEILICGIFSFCFEPRLINFSVFKISYGFVLNNNIVHYNNNIVHSYVGNKK